ncbi:hypothetical protein AciX9_3510 [Granulicella tundricola MP5ACTX9]|uniref:Lipoprotein n=2 Tax=Granulicella TaxID=940557 RepID=E8X407_GRATM|nr:hypothetical protein AciX9_3510 [Granulicella tundricola MP5ACTX9]
MTINQVRMAVLVGAAGALLASVTGCRVEDHKDGDATNVKIATPFGGMSVKTNDKVIQGNMGLDVYPGAVLERKKNENDSAADINMSFGSFHLGVKAVSYTTPDSTDQVMAFYQKDLSKHGSVIKCKDDRPVGMPVRTDDGLTCDDDDKKNTVQVNAKDGKGTVELKFGSKQHQHIVSIEPHDGGTKIGLVALDLPGNFSVTDEDNKQ